LQISDNLLKLSIDKLLAYLNVYDFAQYLLEKFTDNYTTFGYANFLKRLITFIPPYLGLTLFNSIQFNIYCIKHSHSYSNTVTKKNHEFSEEVNVK